MQEKVGAEDGGKHDFVAFEKRTTDIAVERIRKVVTQISQTTIHLLRLVAKRDRNVNKKLEIMGN